MRKRIDCVTLKDNLLLDFEHEAKQKLITKEEQDDSYQFMLSNLEQRWKEKRKDDKSLTKKDFSYIKTILDDEKYTLKQAYSEIIYFLTKQK